MHLSWIADWAWSLPLTALTTIIHIAAIFGMAVLLDGARHSMQRKNMQRAQAAVVALTLLGIGGLALSAISGVESAVWALAYLWLGAIDTMGDAMLYSVNALTTFGSSGLVLERHWRMMGALESANGVVLFGISTGFAAAVITEFWSLLRKPADTA